MVVCVRRVRVETPVDRLDLRAGDIVYLDNIVFTARDRTLRMILEQGAPLELHGLAMYHCGPLIVSVGGGWRVLSAGPTTSARFARETVEVACRYGVKLVIGKGGLAGWGDKLAECGAAYLVFPGGAGSLAAEKIAGVVEVFWLDELGPTEALWVFRVRGFGPLIVVVGTDGSCLRRNLC